MAQLSPACQKLLPWQLSRAPFGVCSSVTRGLGPAQKEQKATALCLHQMGQDLAPGEEQTPCSLGKAWHSMPCAHVTGICWLAPALPTEFG